ncbi:Pectinesterase domain-containing protein [Rhizoctonia solani AG-1 IA]|uniref:Pectinesterase n=1 Tax=Thanatephorus cucumeris (strain AG1-IA) TaxID=983506 RepID=L8WYK2_THACA|nr:Pectinesterase domain-containing protein [Rhizoctonia solani AG-1 IA]
MLANCVRDLHRCSPSAGTSDMASGRCMFVWLHLDSALTYTQRRDDESLLAPVARPHGFSHAAPPYSIPRLVEARLAHPPALCLNPPPFLGHAARRRARPRYLPSPATLSLQEVDPDSSTYVAARAWGNAFFVSKNEINAMVGKAEAKLSLSFSTTKMRFSNRLISSVSLLSVISSVGALASPPPKAITVGKNGKYASLSQALEDTSRSGRQVIIDRPNIKVYGQTFEDDLTYASNQATITNNVPASTAGSNDASGTIRIRPSATGVSIYNLNVANTYGKPVAQSQAIALSVQAGQFGCYGCKIAGYQDTLLANVGAQFYGKNFIEGAVDFIFGQRASIWVTDSTLNTIGDGYITASGRSTNDNTYYVINNSKITGKGNQYLGRPWR